MKSLKLLLPILCTGAIFTGCAHKMPGDDASHRKMASIPTPKKVEFPSLGITLVIKDKSIGLPVAAIFDKNGEYYPEIQSKINKKMKDSTQVGFVVVGSEVHPENKIYKESKESYSTLVINAVTVNGLNNKEMPLKFVVPVERMIIAQKGGKASGLGYWNTTDVRILDPNQKLPF